MAENVLARAIELHHEELDPDPAAESVSYAQLASIAAEIGIDGDLLRRALVEQLETEHDDGSSLVDLVLGPGVITGGMVAEGSREEVAAQLDEWMRELESMYPTRQAGETTTWEPTKGDARLGLALAYASQDRLTSRQTEVSDGDQLVEIEVDMSASRRNWALMGAFFAAIGAVAGGFTAANEAFAPGIVEFLIPFGVGSGLGLAGASVGARMTASMVRRRVNKALDGIVHLTTFGRRGRGRDERTHGDNPAWRDIADEVSTGR